MKFCPNCGAPRAEQADACPACKQAYPAVVPADTTSQLLTAEQTFTAPAAPHEEIGLPDISNFSKGQVNVQPSRKIPNLFDTQSIQKPLKASLAQKETPSPTKVEQQREAEKAQQLESSIEKILGEALNEEPAPARPAFTRPGPVATAGTPGETPEAQAPAAPVFEEKAPVAQPVVPSAPAKPTATGLFTEEAPTSPQPAPSAAPQNGSGPQRPSTTLPPRKRPAAGATPTVRSAPKAQLDEKQEKWQRLGQQTGSGIPELAREAPPGIPLPPENQRQVVRGGAQKKKAKRPGRSLGLVLAAIAVFIIGVSGVTLGMLYYNNNSSKAISSFVVSLGNNDTRGVRDSVRLSNATASEAGWQALCDAFSEPATRSALESQLKALAAGTAGTELAYPSITVESEPLFLFVKRYYVRVTGVDLTLTGEAEGTTLHLGGTALSGRSTEGGALYTGIIPGRYTYQLARSGEELTLPASLELFSLTNTVDARADRATVTITGALSDEATLYVDGTEIPQKPSNGIVVLDALPLGSEVRIAAWQGENLREATVAFTSMEETSLAFNDYSGEEPEQGEEEPQELTGLQIANAFTKEQIDTVLAEFYNSYLASINAQDIGQITRSTESNTQSLSTRIRTSGNAANTFVFGSVTTDDESINAFEADDRPTVVFNARFEYRYTPRDGSAGETASNNYQTVRMVYENGEWLVDAMTYASEAEWNAHEHADLG